jgi:hypothetical protein
LEQVVLPIKDPLLLEWNAENPAIVPEYKGRNFLLGHAATPNGDVFHPGAIDAA